MRKTIVVFILMTLLATACNLNTAATPAEPPVGAGPETGSPQPVASPTPEPGPAALPPASLVPADAENSYWVTNPTSGARLHVQVFYPNNWNGSDLLPALVLMPGGVAPSDPQKAARLAGSGFLVIIFDADGRGLSEGTEDYNGSITQDGLAAVIMAAAQLPGLDPDRYGLVSYSYGVTAATGALARYPGLPVKFYIDWEGPVDRNYTTSGCGAPRAEGIQWQPCAEDAWWAEREAVTFITDVNVPYQRIQSEKDHVQMNNNHAIDIVNAAVAGGVPWVRLNEYPPNQTYDAANPPAMLPEAQDKRTDAIVAEYARHIIENVLPALP
jgi:pimeloyl-ACP methyl ester carboxylesterase